MKLGFNLDFNELDLTGLKKLDQIFLDYLFKADSSLHKDLILFRSTPFSIIPQDYSEFLLKISPYLDDFLAELFCISKEVIISRLKHKDFDIIYECKRKFVQRIAIKKYPPEKIKNIDFEEIYLKLTDLIGTNFTSREFAKQIIIWQQEEESFVEELDIAAQYAAYMVYGQCHSSKSVNLEKLSLDPCFYRDDITNDSILFNLPQKLDKENLIDDKKILKYQRNQRIDFNYTNIFSNLEEALNNSHYCIYCHKQDKDSCSKGINVIRWPPRRHGIQKKIKKDWIPRLDRTMTTGCPLKQKISEMNYVKAQGFNLSALAIIVIDNPMVAATGHRICNDCVRACIYQKQDPVNIPLIESNILEETLKLPYGLEIYLLLTRWNPLNIYAPLPKESTNYNILVTGLGPAGFSLSYYLLRSGHNVTAIDGLKISLLPFDVNKPIKFWHEYKSLLSERMARGFGGVSEYGITIRWDKNNLDILRLILERNDNFKYYDGVTLGSNIMKEQAFSLGFDHIAFCIGAGQPKVLDIENFEAKGVKMASDFLMTLQSGGAFLENSNANMLIRMPIAIIGGGLTSIDAATESLYYYKMQVERFFKDYELAVQKYGKDYIEKDLTEEDKEIAEEFIAHARLFKEVKNHEELRKLFNKLGGSTIYYRGKLQESPAYKLNHEELIYAMALGIDFRENMQPLRINTDKYGHVESVTFSIIPRLDHGIQIQGNYQDNIMDPAIKSWDDTEVLKAKTVIIAIGIENNLELDENKYSYFGDCNPEYSGSVVKALASSKEGYENINKRLINNNPSFKDSYRDFITQLDYLLISRIHKINILDDKTFELVIHSPLAAKNFKFGQFFRLQNYSEDIAKLIEPLALSPTDIDIEKGLISFIVFEVGKSTSLCKTLSENEKVVLMGPTGIPLEIPQNKKIVIVDSKVSNVSLLKVLKENNNEVIFFTYPDIKTRKLTSVDRVIINASPEIIEELQSLKNEIFGENTELIVSVNSSMQCMMKGICGQCIQKVRGEQKYIFACSCQNQKAEIVDFESLKTRLRKNSLQEKMRRLV
ncbi:putative bifunctional glutamate synthase subunit beta/2-polyprenylphenol hydroxylase [Rickettsia canadensis str. McKiel]|uniref:Putative bifunctional glutamate synthase subunit beta/2-polyprenylphenol hydroxylase n=1 Tax=Rickettsia canadensis (strain McKiel) TaxID=293613 RepID=A8EX75_RICCK|nr:bifunctional glutamate synthase subunit beta/2-polyprenylphenol hydroxylase [Rickettsia canadensis]ABV72958.1 putative bifunctional glutamate synthase subunit beta/2-polyprenylphenol hydroxylase [Rickettsia canadensis str. McKiel]